MPRRISLWWADKVLFLEQKKAAYMQSFFLAVFGQQLNRSLSQRLP